MRHPVLDDGDRALALWQAKAIVFGGEIGVSPMLDKNGRGEGGMKRVVVHECPGSVRDLVALW